MKELIRRYYYQLRNALINLVESGAWRESVYRELFVRDLKKKNLEDVYYPINAAANHCLLYFLQRCLGELDLQKVVELGCGQTTLLMHHLNQIRSHKLEITSIEQDEFWAGRIDAQVEHKVEQVKAEKYTSFGIQHFGYKWQGVGALDFDLLLVDGPLGTKKYSRFSAVEIIEKKVQDEFIIAFDDANRPGESDTIRYTMDLLKRRGKKFATKRYRSNRDLFVIASPKYQSCLYF